MARTLPNKDFPKDISREFLQPEERLPLTIAARCEPAPSARRQQCTLSFSGRRDEIEASAGFTFLGNPVAGDIDLRTVQCFHTP